ncbi:MAG: trypsin-like serine protease [Woeseiaceae bacterium]|nr:trypsin-like serine protease [Woeseiaceae bacterium]
MKNLQLILLVCVGLTFSAAAWPIIVSHQADAAAHLRFASDYPTPVVLRRNAAGSADGMGTWIAEDWILTAAHVAEGFRTGDPIGDEGGLVVADVALHPGWPAEPIDLGLIRVAAGPSNIDIVPLCVPDDYAGATVVFLGAGDIGTGKTGPAGADGQMRMARNMVTLANEEFLLLEFDAPGSPSALDLEGISGPGDSGGPAYVGREDGVCVVAVSSGQDTEATGGAEGQYGVVEFYSRADTQRVWIRSIVEAS